MENFLLENSWVLLLIVIWTLPLERSGFMESSQKWSKEVVYRYPDFEYLGHSGDYLHLLLQ